MSIPVTTWMSPENIIQNERNQSQSPHYRVQSREMPEWGNLDTPSRFPGCLGTRLGVVTLKGTGIRADKMN